MSPTIVLRDGQPFLLIGASGGPRIITNVLDVMLYLTDFGMTPEAAMQTPRPHHQWQPNLLYFDREETARVGRGVWSSVGTSWRTRQRRPVVQFILRTESGWLGAADPRKGGRPAGY